MVSDGNTQTNGELMNEAVRVEMEKLRGEKVNVLRARYRELFGRSRNRAVPPICCGALRGGCRPPHKGISRIGRGKGQPS